MGGRIERVFYRVNSLPVAAMIQDLGLNRLGDADLTRNLYADWMRYGVAVFRGTPVNNAQHAWLSRRFGAYTVDTCRRSMLPVLERPEGGDVTLFSDTAAAYDALPEDWARQTAGLQVEKTPHLDCCETARGVNWPGIRWATGEATSGSRPAVYTMMIEHPATGKETLSLSPTYFARVLGFLDEQSDEILSFIVPHTLKYGFVLAANDPVVWEDRRKMHAATGHSPRYRRFALRATRAGSLKSGHLYDLKAVEAKPGLTH